MNTEVSHDSCGSMAIQMKPKSKPSRHAGRNSPRRMHTKGTTARHPYTCGSIPQHNTLQHPCSMEPVLGKMGLPTWSFLVTFSTQCIRGRPYRVECTGSLPTSEVKRRRARLVLGWGTAREDLRVLSAFHHVDGHELTRSVFVCGNWQQLSKCRPSQRSLPNPPLLRPLLQLSLIHT